MPKPPKDCMAGTPLFTIADFIEAGRERLALEVIVGGKGLDRTIEEPIVNRPGLALTGFYENFAWKRLQVIGNSEMAFVKSMPMEERDRLFKGLLEHKARLLIYTCGRRPREVLCEMAAKKGVVILSTQMRTFEFIHVCTFILEALGSPRTSMYGTMIEVCGLGVLIEGDPGLGKSETALGLIKRGYALVADDLTCVRKNMATNELYASASPSTEGYMEIRGIGIMHVPSVFGVNALRGEKKLQLVITFRRFRDIIGEIDRIGQSRTTKNILGVDVPNITIPVSSGRDLVNLVETAALQHRLVMAGHDPVTELSRRLHDRARKLGVSSNKKQR
ncbi:MAG: HPr(Ser) kinase/phosphatase [Kiritimatiellae bacterium]|nr:HPr(Ser) kinase/phosphatase [Kiritimatiellia bacterium]